MMIAGTAVSDTQHSAIAWNRAYDGHRSTDVMTYKRHQRRDSLILSGVLCSISGAGSNAPWQHYEGAHEAEYNALLLSSQQRSGRLGMRGEVCMQIRCRNCALAIDELAH